MDYYFDWTHLPDIPDADGLAGIFSGISSDMLLAAGGCNFPDGGRPWSEDVKRWYSNIYMLESPEASWRIVGRLPRALAYGVSLNWNDRLVCLGGRDGEKFYSEAFMLAWKDAKLNIEYLPDLPTPLANACGVVVANTIFIAGGQRSAVDQETTRIFWSMDLSQADDCRIWQILEQMPGPSRMLSVAAAFNGSVYIFSGVHLPAGGNAQRQYLTDSYKYTPGFAWQQLPELPYPVAAAPSPASLINDVIVIMGGDDGAVAGEGSLLKEAHPGFTRSNLHFDPYLCEWRSFASLPRSASSRSTTRELLPAVTTPAVEWQGRIVIPGGEVKPGFRTSQVIAGSLKQIKSK